jgi:hypothetical protein
MNGFCPVRINLLSEGRKNIMRSFKSFVKVDISADFPLFTLFIIANETIMLVNVKR